MIINNNTIDNLKPLCDNFGMFESYKKYWKQNFARSVGYRRGRCAWNFLAFVFVVNIGIIFAWFAALILIAKLAVVLGFMEAQTAAAAAIVVMEIIALWQLVFFAFTKRGDKLITDIASKMESMFLGANSQQSGTDKPLAFSSAYTSHIPQIPTTPPRLRA